MNTTDRKRFWLGIVFLLAGSILYNSSGNKGHHGKPSPSPSPSPTATPPQVTLAWDADVDTSTLGYNFKLGFTPGGENQVINVGNVLIYTVQLTSGTTYYFVVTAYNANGESLPSNEVQYLAP